MQLLYYQRWHPFDLRLRNRSLRDIATYSDTKLDQYLEDNGRNVTVEDPENLMKDSDFIQRLRARTGVSDSPRSRPIDLNYISTRLGEIPTDGEASSRLPFPATTESSIDVDEEEQYREDLKRQTKFYNALIDQGGRPSHLISLGCHVAKNPGEYREILSYWSRDTNRPDGWEVFGGQLSRWEDFHEHQRYEREKDYAAYCQRLQDRLRRHGFERSFQLDEEPDRQDKLVTWIEYLNYEYWRHDRVTNFIKHRQPRFDEAWKKLVDSKVLRPSEIEGRKDTSFLPEVYQLRSKEIEAKKEVESATLTVKSAEMALQQAQCASQNPFQVDQTLSTARSKLTATTKSLELACRRYNLFVDFYRQTNQYRTARRCANDNDPRILLRWILQQVSFIELELNPAKVAENDSNGGNSERLKRKRANDPDEE